MEQRTYSVTREWRADRKCVIVSVRARTLTQNVGNLGARIELNGTCVSFASVCELK